MASLVIRRWQAVGGLAAASRIPALRWPLLSFLLFRGVEAATWRTLLILAHDRGGAAGSGLPAAGLLLPGVVVAALGSVIVGWGDPPRVLWRCYVAQALAALATGAATLIAAPLVVVVLSGAALMGAAP